jgi:hypothetical protein
VQADYEECDAGAADNTAVYGTDGCAPGCVLPPRCGDGVPRFHRIEGLNSLV